MIEGNYFNDNSDLQLHFRNIRWNEIVEAYEADFFDWTARFGMLRNGLDC